MKRNPLKFSFFKKELFFLTGNKKFPNNKLLVIAMFEITGLGPIEIPLGNEME